MIRFRNARVFTAALLIAMPALAEAHWSHSSTSGFAAGLTHPFTGLDHLLAMVLVGLWSATVFRASWWACPATFVASMITGFGWGATGHALPGAEVLILASVAGLGIALLLGMRPPLGTAMAAVGLVALGHGFAHGTEIPSESGAITFGTGLVLSTVALHGFGVAVALVGRSVGTQRLVSAAGATAALVSLLWIA